MIQAEARQEAREIEKETIEKLTREKLTKEKRREGEFWKEVIE